MKKLRISPLKKLGACLLTAALLVQAAAPLSRECRGRRYTEARNQWRNRREKRNRQRRYLDLL